VPGASNRSAVVEIIIPARYRDTVGGFYAFCYIDTDDALALGREPFGYPKSYARSHMQKTGRAVTAAMKRKDAAVEVSVILGSG
jgi:acetoacetate decarboxylase